MNPKFQTLQSEYPIDLKPRYTDQPHSLLFEKINENCHEYAEWLHKINSNRSVFAKWVDQKNTKNTSVPGWNNGFFPALDMMAYYTIVKEIRPTKIIEVGSGNSTKIARLAIKDENIDAQITSIDPMPRAEIDALSDHVIRNPLETTDLSEIASLEANDILFIDNSHRIFPNSDAMVVFMEILPKLKSGVIVHVHDIYLPYDYPQFMCDRFYNEQYGLAINILANSKRYHTILPCYYISQEEELSKKIKPIWELPALTNGEKHGGSYWLRIGD